MAQPTDDFDFGAQPVVMPAVNILGENEDFEEYSLDDRVDANKLMEHTPFTVTMALYIRYAPSMIPFVGMPFNQWPYHKFLHFCAFASSLGSNSAVRESTGSFEMDDLSSLESVPTTSLKCRLVIPKIVATSHYTDSMLAEKLCTHRGASLTYSSNFAIIRVPGFDGEVKVATVGDKAGRVVAGGSAFVDWHNSVHTTAYSYLEPSEAACRIAFFMLCYLKPKPKDGKLVFEEIKRTGAMSKIVAALEEARVMKYLHQLKKILVRCYDDPANRPSMGHESNPQPFMEFVVSRALLTESDKSKEAIACAMALVNKNYTAQVKLVATKYPEIFGALETKDVVTFLRGTKTVCGLALTSHAAAAAFVEQSRAHVRVHFDLPRKSDSVTWGSVGSSVTNVSQKTRAARSAMEGMFDSIPIYPVDAYGTGKNNYWRNEVLAGNEDVMFYDVRADYIPTLPVAFSQGDIEARPANSGVGRLLYDDTFNGPDEHLPKVSNAAKIAAVIGAGYAGGFLKMAFGSAEDGNCSLGAIPQSVKLMSDAYNVKLSPGGSPHSTEYYLCFVKRELSTKYKYVTRSPVGFDDKGSPVSASQYLSLWMATKAMEMVRSNIDLNVQLLLGVQHREEFVWPTYYPVYGDCRVDLAGAYVSQKFIQARHMPKDTNDEFDFGGKDPIVKSQLNGVNGEATNKDDVDFDIDALWKCACSKLYGRTCNEYSPDLGSPLLTSGCAFLTPKFDLEGNLPHGYKIHAVRGDLAYFVSRDRFPDYVLAITLTTCRVGETKCFVAVYINISRGWGISNPYKKLKC